MFVSECACECVYELVKPRRTSVNIKIHETKVEVNGGRGVEGIDLGVFVRCVCVCVTLDLIRVANRAG